MMDQPPVTLGHAIEDGLVRMKAVWRKQAWDTTVLSEYRRVLRRADSAEVVRAVVDRMIDETTERYPPPPGAFAAAIAQLRARHAETPAHRIEDVDEIALRDARMALQMAGTPEERLELGRQVEEIRRRIDGGVAA